MGHSLTSPAAGRGAEHGNEWFTEIIEKSSGGMANYKYGFHMPENYVFRAKRGLSREVVAEISR